MLLHFRQTLHQRADRFRDARARAFFAVDHALAQIARQQVVSLVEALSHARDLFADLLNSLSATAFHRARTFLKPFGQTPDFKPHAVERGGFAALNLVEARRQGRRHARQLLTYRGRGRVVVARFDRAQAPIDGFRHAFDLNRYRFDGQGLAPFGDGKPEIDIGQSVFEPLVLQAVEPGLNLAREFVARLPDHLRHRLRHLLEPLLEQRAQRLGFGRRGAMFDARAETGHGFLQRADGVIGGGLGFGEALGEPSQRIVERLYRIADLLKFIVGRAALDAGGDILKPLLKRRQGAVHRALAGVVFQSRQTLGDVGLSLAQRGKLEFAGASRRLLHLLDARGQAQLRVAQIGDRRARGLAQSRGRLADALLVRVRLGDGGFERAAGG